jgi:hypothetical protein
MQKIIFLSTLLISLLSCKKEYVNQPEYTLKKGETLDIYFSTNSCCEYCVLNRGELEAVTYENEITVEPYPDDCAGCSFTGAFVFKAIAPGTDTILLNVREASADCFELDGEPEMYIVHVQ